MNRRGFLKALLGAAVAPVVLRAAVGLAPVCSEGIVKAAAPASAAIGGTHALSRSVEGDFYTRRFLEALDGPRSPLAFRRFPGDSRRG